MSIEQPAPESPLRPPFHPLLFYGFSIAIAWTAWAPLWLSARGLAELPLPDPLALFLCQSLGAFAPLLSLVLIARVTTSPKLVERVLRKIRVRGVPLRWFLAPALCPVVIAVVSRLAAGSLSAAEPDSILRPEPVAQLGWGLLLVVPLSFALSMIGSPLGEEPGWRGYVLDHFAERGQAAWGSLLVAVMWWVWHLPLFEVLEAPIDVFSFLEMFGHSLLIDAFFLLSGRNLLAAMLYHQGVNVSFLFFTPATRSLAGAGLLLASALALRAAAVKRPV